MEPVDYLFLIITLHQNCIIRWKEKGVQLKENNFLKLVEHNHAYNFQLWQTEDEARRDDLGYEHVYQAKRKIDGFNQQRNNYMEAMDEWLFQALNPADISACPVHSETPGMMIDRLSILALKAYHMGLQIQRPEVDDAHREACLRSHKIIQLQQLQLQQCLQALLTEISQKTRTFRIYHQFKMYNDPKFR